MQNRRKSKKKTCFKTNAFLTSIFCDFSSILAPKLRSQKVIFFVIFFQMGQCGAQEAPKRPQERPKRPQEAPRGSQEPQRASHSDSFFGLIFECSATHLLFYPMRFLYLVFPIGFSVIDVSCHIFSDFQR